MRRCATPRPGCVASGERVRHETAAASEGLAAAADRTAVTAARGAAAPGLSVARASVRPVAQNAAPDPVRERYESLVDDLMGIDGVTPPPGGSGFGRGSLRYRGKIFAMLVRGHLVVKLPEGRVAELITACGGSAFDANKGTPMREWLSVGTESTLDWQSLASEALAFARVAAR
jgi:hypothetical protein